MHRGLRGIFVSQAFLYGAFRAMHALSATMNGLVALAEGASQSVQDRSALQEFDGEQKQLDTGF